VVRAFSDPERDEPEYGEGSGKLALESLNQNIGQFVPDMLFEQLVKNFANARRILGPRMIHMLTGYQVDTLERNVRYPEFTEELKKKLEQRVQGLKDNDFIDEEGVLTEAGIQEASLELLKSLEQKAKGESAKRKGREGDVKTTRQYKKGDSYKDIDIKASLRKAIRRQQPISVEHLHVVQREAKKGATIIFALDASISMKGEKIGTSKKAGVALAHEAMRNKDKVGAIIFGTNIKKSIPPSLHFDGVLQGLAEARPSEQTDITKVIKQAVEIFPSSAKKKHLVLLTDALPTIGNPDEVIEEVVKAARHGITLTVVGIDLDDAGRQLAEKVAHLGQGRLYAVENIQDIPTLVLQDYEVL
jgi:Mg-chelatase subunit ChlD